MQALHGIDLDAREGEIPAIIGSNGAGKTCEGVSKSHVDRQRLVVVDRDWDPVFADDACGLCSGRENPGILLSQLPSTVAAAWAIHILGTGAAV